MKNFKVNVSFYNVWWVWAGVFSVVSCAPRGELVLSNNLAPNYRVVYRQSQTQDINIKVKDAAEPSFQTQTVDYEYAVKSITPEGNRRFDLTVKAVAISQKSVANTVEFDSREHGDKDLNDPSLRVFQGMVGGKMQFEMDKNGRALWFTGANAMYEEILENMTMDSLDKSNMKRALLNQFGDEVMLEQIQRMTNFYPAAGVRVGKSWVKTDSSQAGMGFITENKYTLNELKDSIAYIGVASKVSSNPRAKGLDLGFMTIQYDMNGTQTGSLEVNTASGWLVASNLKQVLTGKMYMSGSLFNETTFTAHVNMVGVYSTKAQP